jgi:DNA-binding MarR family transcriptional regulator
VSLRRVADQPTWLLSRANARAQAILRSAFAEAGIRGYEYRLMAGLAQYGASSQADLSRLTGIDHKDVVHALNDLEARNLVARAADPADARRNVVTLTDGGGAELVRLDGVLAGVQKEVLAPLSGPERRQLRELLAKLATPPPTDG